MVQAADTREAARAGLVVIWDAARRQRPEQSQVILAYTRDDVRDLNEKARAELRAAGELRSADQVVQTERGARAFAAGDRIMFQQNERGLGGDGRGRGGVAVKNGTLGTVLEVASSGERLTVRLDGQEKGKAGQAVTFTTRDYAHLDHGYAATVHKAQGVTVDRAHVLATPHMDRHAAYVGLTRHRDGVALHYAREDFASPAALARVLGRERAKDTSLDYPDRDGEDLLRRYAERRGLDPLRPDSAIVVRAPEPEQPTPKRSRFAGLKLKAEQDASHRQAADRRQDRAEQDAIRQPSRQMSPEAEHGELRGALMAYAGAWADAVRMTAAGLPVLAHQAEALDRSGQALEILAPNLHRDTRAALERAPELARDAARPEGMAALGVAISAERQARLELDERGRATVRAWATLERAYAAAEKAYDWQGQREVGERMEAFAKALKRDPQLDGVLRQRGRELGVGEGSKLDQVVQAREPELEHTLRRELGLRSGPSLGMGM